MLSACGGGSGSSSGGAQSPSNPEGSPEQSGNPKQEQEGNPGTPVEIPTFEVSFIQPMDASVDVARDVQLIAKFSQLVDGASINNTSFTLTDGNNSVPAMVSFNTETQEVTLSPTAKLYANTIYTATLNTNNKDAQGNAMSSDFSWQFTTVARQVTETKELEYISSYKSYSPKVYTNNAGHALSIWADDPSPEATGDITLKVSNWNGETQQWGVPANLTTKATVGAGYVQVAIEDNGDAVVGWGEKNASGKYDIYYRTYNAETQTWSAAVSIEQTAASSGLYGIHKDSAGNITFVFFKHVNNIYELFTKTLYYRSNQWSNETKLSSDGKYVSQVKTAMDNQGNIMIVWKDRTEASHDIWSVKYTAADFAWAAPIKVNSSDKNIYPAVVRFDGAGNAYLLTRIQISNSFRQAEFFYSDNESSSWSEGTVFGSGSDFTIINSLTVALDGSATLSGYREHRDGAYITSFYAYDPKTKTWADEVVMDDLISEYHSPVTSSTDSRGNVLLIATAKKPREESFSTWYRVYNQQAGVLSAWQSLISDLPNAGTPIVGMSEAGDAFFMWQYALPETDEEEQYYPSHIRYRQFK
jgi:hypothetical protein